MPSLVAQFFLPALALAFYIPILLSTGRVSYSVGGAAALPTALLATLIFDIFWSFPASK